MTFVRQLFTNRFIKDLALIAIFGITLYALIHNPVINPRPPRIQGSWSIQLMQHPLIFGIAGHNYLTLRNEYNEIIRELHGLATEDKENGGWKYYATKSGDVLRVWEFTSPHYYVAQKNYAGVVVTKGTEKDMWKLWNEALQCSDAINREHIPYPPYGIKVAGDTENSNAVAYTLIKCMGLDTRNIGLITPGWGNNLLRDTMSKK